MIRQRIYLDRWDWSLTVYYEAGPEDADRILFDLDSLGAGQRELLRAERNLRCGSMNTGLTFTSSEMRESMIVIGRTTDAAQFQDTFDHEKGHLVMHIGRALGIDPYARICSIYLGQSDAECSPLPNDSSVIHAGTYNWHIYNFPVAL